MFQTKRIKLNTKNKIKLFYLTVILQLTILSKTKINFKPQTILRTSPSLLIGYRNRGGGGGGRRKCLQMGVTVHYCTLVSDDLGTGCQGEISLWQKSQKARHILNGVLGHFNKPFSCYLTQLKT